MEKEPSPLDQPMSTLEREHRHVLYENITREKEQDLIDMYMKYVALIETDLSLGDMTMACNIIDTLYCELIERGVEFYIPEGVQNEN